MNRKKKHESPLYDITHRGYNVKAWYLEDTLESRGDALIEVRRGGDLLREFVCPAYKVYIIAAHFGDIVDGTGRAMAIRGLAEHRINYL